MWRLFIAALLAAAGLAIVYVNWSRARLARAAKGWPRVAGTVTESRIEAEQGDVASGTNDTVYAPRLAYDYEFGGARYTGHNIEVKPEPSQADRAAAEKRLAPYPVGQQVEVMVNPAKPDQAVLVAHAKMEILFPILFLGLAAVVATGVLGG